MDALIFGFVVFVAGAASTLLNTSALDARAQDGQWARWRATGTNAP